MLGQGALNGSAMAAFNAPRGGLVTLPDSQAWRLRVLVDGADVSDRLTGVATVEAEESAARLCSFNVLPEPGVVEPDGWTGKSVQLFSQRLEGDQVAAEVCWFTGWAQKPKWNVSTQVLALTATCQRQRRLADMSLSAVRELVGGEYAEGISGAADDSERYAADLLSTRPRALDCGPDGAFRITDWAALPSPSFILTADEIVDGSLDLELATADQLINQVELTVEYRYQRLRWREFTVYWTHPGNNFCGWLAMDTELPTRSMVRDALSQGSWSMVSLQYLALPPTGPNPCSGVGVWINRWADDPHLLSFTAKIGTRSSQTLTETYPITLTATGSVSSYGVRARQERYSDEVEFDSSDWESQGGGRPAGAIRDELGDWVVDRDDAERRADLLRTALAIEQTKVLAQHRLNRLKLQIPIMDELIDLVHTVEVQALGVRARGKVARVTASWDHDSGSAVASIELALSRSGVHVEAPPIVLPERPVFDFGPAPDGSIQLGTQLGGRPDSPPLDEELDGFSGNYNWLFPGAPSYPRSLQITTPDIAAAHRDAGVATRESSYTVSVPNDLLEVEVV